MTWNSQITKKNEYKGKHCLQIACPTTLNSTYRMPFNQPHSQPYRFTNEIFATSIKRFDSFGIKYLR